MDAIHLNDKKPDARLNEYKIQPAKDKIEILACIAIARKYRNDNSDTPPGLVGCLTKLLQETTPATRPLLRAAITSIRDNVPIVEVCPVDQAMTLTNFAEEKYIPGRTWDRIMDDAEQALQELKLARAIYDQNIPRIIEGWNDLNSAAQSKSSFPLLSVSELTLQPPDWLADGLVERDSIVLIFGDPETGKSLLFATDLAACVSTGQDFQGHKVRQGNVVVIAGEGHNGLARRFSAWEIRNGVSLNNGKLHISKGPAQFCDNESTAQVISAVDQVAKSEPIALVIVDTLNRNFGPGDENSTHDMTRFVGAMDQIRTKYGCTVIIIHHTGHNDKTRGRGAMALKGSLDAEYRLERETSGIIRLWPIRMKDSETPAPMAFQIRSVQLGIKDDQGRPVTSAVMDKVK